MLSKESEDKIHEVIRMRNKAIKSQNEKDWVDWWNSEYVILDRMEREEYYRRLGLLDEDYHG